MIRLEVEPLLEGVDPSELCQAGIRRAVWDSYTMYHVVGIFRVEKQPVDELRGVVVCTQGHHGGVELSDDNRQEVSRQPILAHGQIRTSTRSSNFKSA